MLLLGVVAIAGSAALALRSLSVPYPGINREGYELIRPGLTLPEVIVAVGVSPGVYGTKRHDWRGPIWGVLESSGEVDRFDRQEHWISDRWCISLQFDSAGKVVGKKFGEVYNGSGGDSYFYRLLRRLGI